MRRKVEGRKVESRNVIYLFQPRRRGRYDVLTLDAKTAPPAGK